MIEKNQSSTAMPKYFDLDVSLLELALSRLRVTYLDAQRFCQLCWNLFDTKKIDAVNGLRSEPGLVSVLIVFG